MSQHSSPLARSGLLLVVGAATIIGSAVPAAAQALPPAMEAGWEAYIAENDRQVAEFETGSDQFLHQHMADDPKSREARDAVARGQVFVTPYAVVRGRHPMEVPDALVHHWGGTVHVPGVTLEEVLALVQDYARYPEYFGEVETASVLQQDGDHFEVALRIRRRQVITVHYNTVHDVQFERHGPGRATQRGVVTKIAELDNAGEADEREKPHGEDQGFLWRLNSNWRYEERDGGVTIEAEAISLSRRVPRGLGWLVGGFVESIPRESMEDTLESLRAALLR